MIEKITSSRINNQTTDQLYREYAAIFQYVADFRYAAALLQWDQETYMPVKSAARRARQIASVTQKAHEISTAEQTGMLLQELAGRTGLTPDEKCNIDLSLYDHHQQKKLSPAFVHTLSEAASQSFQSWHEARLANSFAVFEKDLTRMVELKRQEADHRGYAGHPYDALLNQFERGCTVAFLDDIFRSLQQPLKALLFRIGNQPQVNNDFLSQHFPKDQQWQYGTELLAALGFDFMAGRQDISEHPFTTNFSSTDVRVTTRIDEHDFSNMTWSCIHEAGHALYEQGLPDAQYGLPLGEFTSLGIHESQSRIWENNVGRSVWFWNAHFKQLQTRFPGQFGNINAREFYKGINKVQSTLIRTEADELTYHFHVIIRYELEKKLLEGGLQVKDIPDYWNAQYEKYLNIKVPDDKHGCLQDVHWSHGSFGYFATYSLGSLYAAQFFSTAVRQVPGMEPEMASGRTACLLDWLRTNIHVHGRKFTSACLCQQITGETLNIRYFLEYAAGKYRDIYNFRD